MSQPNASGTDGELVAAALDGSDEAFRVLFQRYRRPLLSVARSRLRDADRAEDVVQETFLSAHRSLATYDSRYSFRTWLWTILLNGCKRNHAKHSRKPSVRGWSETTGDATERGIDPASGSPSPTTVLLAKERDELLERSLDRLPTTEADALRLRFFAELKFQEIADATGCSLGTAKNRVRKGLVRLATIVTETEALAELAECTDTNDEV